MDPLAQSSEPLIDRARLADREALEQLLIRHLPSVEGYLRLQMGPALRAKESCADLVQSVALEALQDLSHFEYRGEAAFRHWLCTRAHHKLLERHRWHTADKRDMGREQTMVASQGEVGLLEAYRGIATPSRDLQAKEAVARIEQAFDSLPPDYKEAISMHRILGLSHADIAARLGRTEGAVRNLVYRGLSRLALQLAEQEDGPL